MSKREIRSRPAPPTSGKWEVVGSRLGRYGSVKEVNLFRPVTKEAVRRVADALHKASRETGAFEKQK